MAKGGHSDKENRKIMKQLKQSKDIAEIKTTAKGYRIILHDGRQFGMHLASNGFHHLRRWLKKNTDIKNLRWS